MPTVQILLRNNKNTIDKALLSVRGIGNIVVGDMGSDDGSVDICLSYGAEVVDLRGVSDYSQARNKISREGANFYIEPWEFLFKGGEYLFDSDVGKKVYIINNGIVSKETRVWMGEGRFKNPVYETIVGDSAKCDPRIMIVSGEPPNLRAEKRAMVESWLKSRPISPEPYYYMAFTNLSERKYDDFLLYAKKYIAMEDDRGMESIMLYYYMSQINMHKGRIADAAREIMLCVAFCPWMSEFWCLLGDLFCRQKKLGKAKSMYENALIVGKRRKNSDDWPVEISKYKEYPETMIKKIDEISGRIIESVQKTKSSSLITTVT